MSALQGSVGVGGTNQAGDVRTVQQLLNRNGSRPMLREDGEPGPRTVQAIKRFQTRIVRLRHADGRVDPRGRTHRKLLSEEGRKPASAAPTPTGADPAERQEYRRERRRFVDPRVKENATTTKIIDALYPHFADSKAKVISGWLSDSDLFWKVDYHWEYLLWMAEHVSTLNVSQDVLDRVAAIGATLQRVSPSPDHGYRTSAKVGSPVDKSSAYEMTVRHKVVSQQKRAFDKIVRQARLIQKSSRPADAFHLAAAPVAHPGTSKHSSGYALDIKGSAGTIKSVCRQLGASLVFDEKSHIHVEFKNGVNGGGA